ncbi:MAG: hypothetical protein HFE83_13320 [Lachnospiraceae bacterium]|jgi:hypothetical protein|nr:hypothetical protein [Lachnospiraceae bacterium]
MQKISLRIMETGYYVVCFSVLTEITSYAYIDPSVTTYAIQAIAGGAIAIGAVAGIYWRKAKRKLNDKLGIHEKKEIEEDVIETEDSTL